MPQRRVSLSGCAALGPSLTPLSLRFPNQSKSCRFLPLGVYDSARLQCFGRALLPSSELGNKPTSLPSSLSQPHPRAAPKLPPSPAVSTSHCLPHLGSQLSLLSPGRKASVETGGGPGLGGWASPYRRGVGPHPPAWEWLLAALVPLSPVTKGSRKGRQTADPLRCFGPSSPLTAPDPCCPLWSRAVGEAGDSGRQPSPPHPCSAEWALEPVLPRRPVRHLLDEALHHAAA